MSDKANQSAENLSKQYDEITKQTQLAKKEIEEALVIQANTDQVHKSINAIKDYVKSGTFELGGAGLFPDKAVENADNLEKIQKRLPLYEKALAENVEKISNLTEDEVGKRKKLEEINKKITAKIREQAKHAEELTEQTDKYLRIGEQIKKNPFGSDKVEKMEEGLFKAHFRLKELSNRGGKFSGVLGKVSEAAGTLGTKIKGIAFPVAVLSQVMSLGKYLLDIQSKFSGIAREIEGTGAFAIGGPDLDKNLSEAEGKMRNISGLMSRRFGGDAFALGREEIQGMVGAMDQAGMKASKMKDIFKDVNTTTAAQGNEFLKAADMAHVFAGAMGTSRQEVAGMMGDMFFNYTQNGKAIQESFAQIAAASQDSSIGTNRFLGMVQTATAGMSLYERQVADTAIALKNMTEASKFTGKEAETAARSASEFAQDTHKVIGAFALMEQQAPGTLDKIASSVQDEINVLEDRKKKGEELSIQEEQQLKNMKEFTKAMSEGNIADAGALLKQVNPEAQMKVVGNLIKQIDKMSGGSAFKKEELMGSIGMGKEMAVLSQKMGDRLSDGLMGEIERGNNLVDKQTKDQDKRDDKTGDLNNKIISSLGEGLGSTVNTISNTLLAILSIIGGSQILKIGKSITGMMGGGGGGLISKAKSALGVGADVAEAGAKTGKMGKLGKMGSDLAGKIGKTKIGGGVLKGASKILKMGKAIPVLGSLVAAGFAAKDVWKIGEGLVEGKGVDKGALASLGMNALSMVPVVGTAAAIADVGLSASGVYDKLSAESVGSNNLKPSMPESPVITSRAAGSSSNMVASNVGGGSNGTVNISINGGDIQKVRAVVQQEVTKALGKTRTG
jgi:methyl-accepting chemotaxis protein